MSQGIPLIGGSPLAKQLAEAIGIPMMRGFTLHCWPDEVVRIECEVLLDGEQVERLTTVMNQCTFIIEEKPND